MDSISASMQLASTTSIASARSVAVIAATSRSCIKMQNAAGEYVFGFPPPDLIATPPHAVQLSPLSPGAESLADLPPGVATQMLIAAPSGTLERRFVLALALEALREQGELVAVARKEKGGSRLGDELRAFGCKVEETGRRHYRLCQTTRPSEPVGLKEAIDAGGLRFLNAVGRWTQPGIFSWDRLDPGTELLITALPSLAGLGVDLGCGSGRLGEAVLASGKVTCLHMFDIDRRAIEAARRNVGDRRTRFSWTDALTSPAPVSTLDFVVMNPPFHQSSGGVENRKLGQDFIRVAHRMLRADGVLWMVANRHLPYEAVLHELFSTAETTAEAKGFKVIAARK